MTPVGGKAFKRHIETALNSLKKRCRAWEQDHLMLHGLEMGCAVQPVSFGKDERSAFVCGQKRDGHGMERVGFVFNRQSSFIPAENKRTVIRMRIVFTSRRLRYPEDTQQCRR
ncbi:MAG: hypothetical protein D6820_02615 [Lentisphaerae bacterium]|nr:MAG: hypothetical protein D6820_02615 [Lentisphaerota bacterium]